MNETVLVPSPNWFLVSVLRVSRDGWIIYGGPTKGLCVLEPLSAITEFKGVIQGSPNYRAHVFNKAHGDKIVSVDISPEWPEKMSLLTGSIDGSVKQWSLEGLQHSKKIKSMLSHEIHSQEKEEVAGVGYSTESYAVTVGNFGNLVKWDLKSNVVKAYNQLKNFKPVCMACSPHITLQVAVGTKQGLVFVMDLNDCKGNIIYKVRGQDEEILNLSWCPQYEVTLKKTLKESEARQKNKENKCKKDQEEEISAAEGDTSGVEKKLPDDSFDSVELPEDDMFDIYKDHEEDEFGHKKYQPEDILVKIPKESKVDDYLADCLKLKEEILKRKNNAESSLQSLVEALDKTHVDSETTDKDSENAQGSTSSSVSNNENKNKNKHTLTESSLHIHKHLLATISKHGSVRVWSKTGKLVSTCSVSVVKGTKAKTPAWPTLCWYKPDTLLLTDVKNQLLQCNPLNIDCKNKLDWSVVHNIHKRGIYCIATNAPREQSGSETDDSWSVWTVSQDRNIVQYSLSQKKKICILASCGGFLYTVLPCPYDAGKIAVSVGDGAVRIIHSNFLESNETAINEFYVTSIWQNVQGKVLTVAWHPTKENLLAFATAESRIGLIDTSSKAEKPAKVLVPALHGPIYSISWGESNELYACAAGELVLYHINKPYEAPVPVRVVVEGHPWEVSTVRHHWRALVVGGCLGAVALLTSHQPHTVLAAKHIFSKMIYMTDWHPQQTTNASEESPYKNMIAVCSQDKSYNILILEYIEKEDGNELQVWKTLSGHKLPVLQLMWNPHHDAQLLSTSQDGTVRVWEAVEGVCTSIFSGHTVSALGATWCAQPQLCTTVVSGGADGCLRMWAVRDHPANIFEENNHDVVYKKDKKPKHKGKDKKEKALTAEQESAGDEDNIAANLDFKPRGPKRFLLPKIAKQTGNNCKVEGAQLLLKKCLEKSSPERLGDVTWKNEDGYDMDFIKMFGTINEVNELLDMEMENHLDKGHLESWIVLAIFRGRIDDMIQFASQRDLLCPYLLSIAPCVSLKYWKDATQLYIAQIDRFVAKGSEDKLFENKGYGGAVYRKAVSLLSVHDVKGAVATLTEAKLFKEAYLLCRTRYMDSIAEQTLHQWAKYCLDGGTSLNAAICYIALGNFEKAANILGNRKDQESLKLAADLAKINGQLLMSHHISERRDNVMNSSEVPDKTEEIMKELPSRIQALLTEKNIEKANVDENGDIEKANVNQNGAVVNGNGVVSE